MFGFVFMSHKADCRVSGILVVKGFGVLRDRSLDLEFFMWLVRIQTEQNHKKQISKRDACYDCASPGQREQERKRERGLLRHILSPLHAEYIIHNLQRGPTYLVFL